MVKKNLFVRKAFALLSVMAILMSLFCITTSAETTDDVIELPDGIYYFEDGSYIFTERFELDADTRAVGTKRYSKRSTYYDNNGVAQCALEVLGTFTVNFGTAVKCSEVTAKTYVYKDGWTIEDVSKSCTSTMAPTASATASGNFVYKVLGITLRKFPVSVTVSCDKSGTGY